MKMILRLIFKWIFIPVFSSCLLGTGALFFFKDRICQFVLSEVNTNLKVPIQVAEMDLSFWASFPNLSVDLEHLYVQESFEKSKKTDTLFYTDRLRLSFNPLDIYHGKYHVKKISVNPGKLVIRFNEKGEANYNILKSCPSPSNKDFKLTLKEIVISSLEVVYKNEVSHQSLYANLEQSKIAGDFSAAKFVAKSLGKLNLKRLNSGEITLVKNKNIAYDFAMNVDQKNGIFTIDKAELLIEKLPFSLLGKVTPDSLHFHVQSTNIQLADLVNTLSLDAAKDVKTYKGKGKIDFNLKVNGALTATELIAIKCEFKVENGSLTEPEYGVKIADIQLNGEYENTGSLGEYVALRKVQFNTIGGPFSGNFLLTEFKSPKLKAQANGVLNLRILHAIFHLPGVDRITGAVQVKTDLSLSSNPTSGEFVVERCDGQIDMKNVGLKLLDDQRNFKELNGHLFLRGNKAGIKNATLKVGSSDLKINGVFENIFPYINATGKLKSSVSLESKHLKTEDLAATSKTVKMEHGAVFSLPNNIVGEVNLDIEKLSYGTHHFEQLRSKMNIHERRLYFPQLSVVNAGAQMNGSLMVEEKQAERFVIITQIGSNNIRLKALFKEWDNFDQGVITDENISGKAAATVFFRAPFHLSKGIDFQGIEAKIDLKVVNGHLKNVASFKDITESLKTKSGKLVLGKSNIDALEKKWKDIDFETMENSIIIQKGMIEIPKMTIRSTALAMDLSGRHSFDNDIDYRIAFRFRDLKQQNYQSEFGQIIDDGTGIRLYLRMHGSLDNPMYEWDDEGRKLHAKEYREQEKKQAKSMLKAEFGFFQKDSTVKAYVPIAVPKEELNIKFGTTSKQEFPVDKKPPKESKLKKTLNSWKEQQKQEEKTIVKLKSGGG